MDFTLVKIEEYLKLTGLSVQNYADLVKVTKKTVYRYLEGYKPSRKVAKKMEKRTNGFVTVKDYWDD